MRHSHAVDEHNCRDFDRQLTKSGRQLAAETGQRLNELNVVPDFIIASSAARTMQTGQQVVAQFENDIPLIARDDLYQSRPSVYLPAIQSEGSPDTPVVLAIGHNPGIGSLISSLAAIRLAVPPATMGVYSIDTGNWLELSSLSTRISTLTHLIVDAQLVTEL